MTLGLHSRDRYRDFFFLGLKYETETETQFLGFSRPRLWRYFFSYFFETETETELFIISRPWLRLGWVSEWDFSRLRPRLFHYGFWYGAYGEISTRCSKLKFIPRQLCKGLFTFGDDENAIELDEYVPAL